MATTVWPPISPDELKVKEDSSVERELEWLLESLQESLVALKSGLEECYALLAPIEPGSTLVVSSPKSEYVKGHITRVGTSVTKGSLHLRLKTCNPAHFVLAPDHTIILNPLANLRSVLNQSLDCVDITRWTGDRTSATFISSQFRLLHSLITEARTILKGSVKIPPSTSDSWHNPSKPPNVEAFKPPLPETLSLYLSVREAYLVLTVRVLEPADAPQTIGTRFAFAIGAQRRLEHDEMDETFNYLGHNVRVKEKVRVESADPSLIAVMAKLAALDHTIGLARKCLSLVMGEEMEMPEI